MKINPTNNLQDTSPIKANFSIVITRLTIFSLFIGLILCDSGCTTYKSTAGKTIVSVDRVVDEAMKDWAIYVKIHGATPQQQNAVREYYERYQQVLKVSNIAYARMMQSGDKSIWADASKALLEASGSFVQAITVAKASSKPLMIPPTPPTP